jgi:hypothetical protein
MPGGRQCTVGASARSCTIDALTRRAYTVTVTAANRVGRSAVSAPTNEVTPLDDAPPAPAGIRAIAGDQEAVVNWSAPAGFAEIITGYRVVSSPGGFTCSTKDLSCAVTGLTNGVAYTFRVIAASSGGESPASEPTSPVTPASVPSSPRAVRAVAGDRSVSVFWNAPSDNGGAPITGYTATAWPGGRECSTTEESRECVIGGLPNGQPVTVTVAAKNRVGASERSPGSVQVTPKGPASKPAAKPSAKPAVRLARGKASAGKVTVRWSAKNATAVNLTWAKGDGKPRSRKVAASGRMTLAGERGTRWKVTARAVEPVSKPVSRVFRIR